MCRNLIDVQRKLGIGGGVDEVGGLAGEIEQGFQRVEPMAC